MKAESSQLIPRKLIENLELLFVIVALATLLFVIVALTTWAFSRPLGKSEAIITGVSHNVCCLASFQLSTAHTYMAHAVAFAAIRTTKTWEHFAESSYTMQLWVQTIHNTRIVLPVASTIAWAEICFGCWRDRPFLNRTHLVFDEVIPMGRQQATRPDSDEDCRSHRG